MKNFIPADAFPYRNATGALYDSGQYHLAMKRTAEIAGYEQLRKEQVELRKKGHLPRHRRGYGDGADQLEPHSCDRRLCLLPAAHRSFRVGDGFFQHGRAGTGARDDARADRRQPNRHSLRQDHRDSRRYFADALWLRHRQQPFFGGLDAVGMGGGKIDARQDSRDRRAPIGRRAGKARDRRRQGFRQGKQRAVHCGDGNRPHRLRRDSPTAGKHGARFGSHGLFHQSQYRLHAG